MNPGIFIFVFVILFGTRLTFCFVPKTNGLPTSKGIYMSFRREKEQENMINNYIQSTMKSGGGVFPKPPIGKGEIPYIVFLAMGDNDRIEKGKAKKVNIGTFYLGASAACGDFVDLGGTERTFEIKRVTHIYRYENCKFVVYRKKLDVVAASPSCLKVISSTNITGGFLE